MTRDDYIMQREMARLRAEPVRWYDRLSLLGFCLAMLYIVWAAATLAAPWLVQWYMEAL